jgi:hypothetical protein
VLAAGVRQAVGPDDRLLAAFIVAIMRHADEASRTSAGHTLTMLQALHAAGVDAVTRGPG